MGIEFFRQIREMGKPVIEEVSLRVKEYLDLAKGRPSIFLSEYVGDQKYGQLTQFILSKYGSAGQLDVGHGYDDDVVTKTVSAEIMELTGARQIAIVQTGTAANLCLIASFCKTAGDGEVTLVANDLEHTVTQEGEMLQAAGIDRTILIPSEGNNGIISPNDLEHNLKAITGRFIFQMAIPSNVGVIPTIDELRTLIEIVHKHGGYFLIDGARLTNALVTWDEDLGFLTRLGVDGCTIGTSKKGGLAEVVCVNDQAAAEHLPMVVKSYGHLPSKGSASALVTGVFLTTGYWREQASLENRHALQFASYLAEEGQQPCYPVDGNMVLIKLPDGATAILENDPNVGMVYDDYGPEGKYTRFVFTADMTDKSIELAFNSVKKLFTQG